MRLIVDGYNLYFTGLCPRGEPRQIREAREAVIEQVARYARRRRIRAVVFFDGGPAGQHMPRVQYQAGIELRFSEPRVPADNDIKLEVARWAEVEEVRVVTSDADLARSARAYGAEVVSSEEFAAELGRPDRPDDAGEAPPPDEPPEKYGLPPRNEVDYWLRVFRGARPGGGGGPTS